MSRPHIRRPCRLCHELPLQDEGDRVRARVHPSFVVVRIGLTPLQSRSHGQEVFEPQLALTSLKQLLIAREKLDQRSFGGRYVAFVDGDADERGDHRLRD